MTNRHYIIDGYSLLHKKHPGQLKDREAIERLREELIRRLDQWLRPGVRATLVFDGQRYSRERQHAGERYQVVYTQANQTADAYIERLCQAADRPERVTIVSSDRAVVEYGAAAGCRTQTCRTFLDELVHGRRELGRAHKQVNRKARGPRLGDFFPES